MINARQKADEAKKFEKTMVFVRFWVDSGGVGPSGPRRGRRALKPFWEFLDRISVVRSSTAGCHLNDGGRIDDALRGEGTSRHRSRHRDRHREFGRLGPELNNGLSILFWRSLCIRLDRGGSEGA